jgi:hypothetical protein
MESTELDLVGEIVRHVRLRPRIRLLEYCTRTCT